MWPRRSPTNIILACLALAWWARPCWAVLKIDASCNEFRTFLDEGFVDAQRVTEKAYRRLLAIKTGDTKAKAAYQSLFGKNSNPEDRIDESKWRHHFYARDLFKEEYFKHPGSVIAVFDRLRNFPQNPVPIKVECGSFEGCDKNTWASTNNGQGPEEPGSTISVCREFFGKMNFHDARPASLIAKEGLNREGAVSKVATVTRILIHELTHCISIGGGYLDPSLFFPNNAFTDDWAYEFGPCSDLANRPNPLQQFKQPVSNADSYATLAIMLDLEKYDFTTGEVDAATGKPIPRPSELQKLDEGVKGWLLDRTLDPNTADLFAGTDRAAAQYRRADEDWLETQNANSRRAYRREFVKGQVQNYQVPLGAAICLSERQIPLEKGKRAVLHPFDPRVIEWRKQCGAPELPICRFIPPNYCHGDPPPTVSAKKASSKGFVGPVLPGQQSSKGFVGPVQPGKQSSKGFVGPVQPGKQSPNGITSGQAQKQASNGITSGQVRKQDPNRVMAVNLPGRRSQNGGVVANPAGKRPEPYYDERI
ncbi:MAG: hypothetical protein M1823_000430 [Watsoniomyces obsoletus]|nr:MAG: hypothetical protein M1823_000430 [Watsoniomyces obsoletus]